jgi:signal transduction histidine kinase
VQPLTAPNTPSSDVGAILPEQEYRLSVLTGGRHGDVVALSPPRIRVEWVVAGTRVVLAAGALVAIAIDPLEHVQHGFILYLLGCYLVYSLGMLALVWAPVRFAPGWDLAVHLFDFGAFTVLMLVTEGATSPFFTYLLFLLVCGTLRWQTRGTLWTAGAALLTYAAVTVYGVTVLNVPGFQLNTFLIRCVNLAVFTILFLYLGSYEHRFRTEVGRLAAWPRRLPRDSHDVVSEVLSQASALLEAPTVIVIWQDKRDGVVTLACRRDGHVSSTHESQDVYFPLVLPSLKTKSFQASDAAEEHGRVIALTSRGFQRRACRPINEQLRARFDMHAVQSWPLEGQLVRGRMFCLDKQRLQIDDLAMGELVSQLVLSRLEGLKMLGRLREAAALEERVRVARDLHDSLLQSQAGAALQLLAARRMLERDHDAARDRLQDVQDQLERGELEMRSFIRDLRPDTRTAGEVPEADLTDRLENLRRRMERQWELKVELRVEGTIDHVPAALRDDVYRLAQEAAVNAARHASASRIAITLSVSDAELRLEVIDDGRGFPFHGTYDLATLTRLNCGPRTLKERVSQLAGDLTLNSMTTGTSLLMRLPFATSHH